VPHVTEPPPRTDRSPWNWVLAAGVVIPLCTFLYNDVEPRLFGFPKFYWVQLSFLLLSVASTALVYVKTRKR
jgi:hypothetical protein